MPVKLAERFSVETGRLPAMSGLELCELHGPRRFQIRHALGGFLEQAQVNMLSLQSVIVIESVRIDQHRATAPVFRDELFGPIGTHFLAQLRQLRLADSVRSCPWI